jgi:parallel beta-helix repeat protein
MSTMFRSSRLLLLPLVTVTVAACSDAATPVSPEATSAALVAAKEITACHTVIRQPGVYLLANDLTGCPELGIEIASSNVTLQLNGHTISGSGLSVGIGIGRTLLSGVQRVSVLGPGTVERFQTGIMTAHMMRSTIRGLTVRFNDHGLGLNRGLRGDRRASSQDTIVANTFSDNRYHGVSINGGEASLFIDNISTRNGAGHWDGFGFYLYDAHGIELRSNWAIDNYQSGIVAQSWSIGNRIIGNRVLGNGAADLVEWNCPTNTWSDNQYDTAQWPWGCAPVPATP